VHDDGPFGPQLHHPLLIELFFDPCRAALINHRYRLKSKAVEEKLRDRRWASYVFMHERPYRLDALLRCATLGFAGAEYWKLVGEVWAEIAFAKITAAMTKRQIAEKIAKDLPDLSLYMPPERKPWMSEHARMGIFGAAALAWMYFHDPSTEIR
jgi:hypothetical protein